MTQVSEMQGQPRAWPTTLLVEDSADAREAHAAYFKVAGPALLVASSAAEGFALALEARPDVIITDIRLDGGPDGLTLAMKLRLDARTRHIPIIALTGADVSAARRRAAGAGCDVFLEKPCPPDVLVEHVMRVARPATIKR